jgi:hypothetical protein
MKPLSDRLTDRELIQRGDLTLAFRARDSVLDRPVFVKCLNPALAADREIRARFEREAKAVARLDHPNLVRIYEYGEDPHEGLYMLLEWLEGSTLAAEIAAGKRYAGDEFIRLASQLLSGLSALHGAGVLHRDLKPDNVLLRADGSFKITDFSLASLRDAPKLTHHEAIVGTPAYMSPEQASGGTPGERSDLFSLGVVLYEAASGKNPFLGATVLETLRGVREREISLDEPAPASLSERARSLLRALLEKNPDRRPSSAVAALELIGESTGATEEQSGAARRGPRRLAFLAVAAAVLLAAKLLNIELKRALLYLPLVLVGMWAVVALWNPDARARGVRTRSRKRDLIHLSAAAAVLLFWSGMMLWYPWHKKAEAEHRVIPATTKAQQPPGEQSVSQTAAQATETESDTAHSRPAVSSRGELPLAHEKTVPELRAPSERPMAAVPDSVDLQLSTEPWAHVFLNGVQLGTTPLSAPLHVPGGAQTFVLRNPAYPPVQLSLDLRHPVEHAGVRLDDHVALVQVRVVPWGELYLDGEHVGTTPLARPLYVSPGKHTVRVSHPRYLVLQHSFEAAMGETLNVTLDLPRGRATIGEELRGRP